MDGYPATAYTYYTRGSGPILEEDMPFKNYSNSYFVAVLSDVDKIELSELPRDISKQKVDNVIYFPFISQEMKINNDSSINEIRNQIKRHIMENGSVTIDIFAPGGQFYNEQTYAQNCDYQWTNHSVSIIGWDDNYSKDNFAQGYKPSKDGAYIVLNSWGENWGDNGVYYLSYEDACVEASARGIISASDIEYDEMYQYDTNEIWRALYATYGANIFQRDSLKQEKLTEIMVYFYGEAECELYLNAENDNLQTLTKISNQTYSLKYGYNTIKLDQPIDLEGENFAVAVKILSENPFIGIEDRTSPFSNAVSNVGESYISEDGQDWEDIYDENDMMNLSIKAYTVIEEEKFEVGELKYTNRNMVKPDSIVWGAARITAKTSAAGNDDQIDVVVKKGAETVTQNFAITGTTILSNIANIQIKPLGTAVEGTYTVELSYKSFPIEQRTFIIQSCPQEYTIIQVEDEALYNTLKNKEKSTYSYVFIYRTDEKLAYSYNDDTKEIMIENIEGINSLNLEGYGITSIRDLEKFVNLEALNIENNMIDDYTPIANFYKMKNLQLNYGLMSAFGAVYITIDNLDFLEDLKQLEFLELTSANVDENDLSIISDCYNLWSLDLAFNPISDISFLSQLSNLRWLSLDGCNVEDISLISNLTSLQTLVLQRNQIKNIDVLANLNYDYLHELYLGVNQIEDFTAIENINPSCYVYLAEQYIEKSVGNVQLNSSSKIELPDVFRKTIVRGNQEESSKSEPRNIYKDGIVKVNNCTLSQNNENIILNTEQEGEQVAVVYIVGGLLDGTVLTISYNVVDGDVNTISFDLNGGGTNTIAPKTGEAGEIITLPNRNLINSRRFVVTCDPCGGNAPVATVEAPTLFKEWNTKRDGSGISYEGGAEYTINGDATLYAQYDYSTSYIDSNTPNKPGSIFLGWYTEPEGEGKKVDNNTLIDKDMTVYAHWEAIPGVYTVAYNANGGSGAPGTQIKQEGIALTLSSKKPTRNYTVYLVYADGENDYVGNQVEFLGWNTQQGGSGQTFQPGDSYEQDVSVTLYAQWSPYVVLSDYYDDWYRADGTKVSDNPNLLPGETIYEKCPEVRTLSKIEITTQPNKTTYKIGDIFDKTGMVVKATYSDGTNKVVIDYTISPSGALKAADTKVTISYTEGKITKTTDQAITVLDPIEIKSDIYTIDKTNKYIFVPKAKTTLGTFVENIDTNADTDIPNPKKQNYIGTGMELILTKGTDIETYKIIVMGDLDGDGIVSAADLLGVKRHILSSNKPEWMIKNIQFKAADLRGDGSIDVRVLLEVKRLVLTGLAN